MNQDKLIALVVNLFVPGAGTIMAGKKQTGIIQIVLFGLSLLLIMTFFGAILGFPLYIGVWIWGIITIVTMDDAEFEKKKSQEATQDSEK